MLDKYLRNSETIESRLDDLLDTARRSNSTTVKDATLGEAQVLATILQGQPLPAAYATLETATPEGVYGLDQVAEALDNVFEGRQAPVALKAGVLALLANEATHDTLGSFVVSDSALLPPNEDGSTPMVEGQGTPYVDDGVDLDAVIDGDNADQEMADRLEAEAEDFPEFATPEAEKTKALKKKTGGKKTAAQRAAEEAGL